MEIWLSNHLWVGLIYFFIGFGAFYYYEVSRDKKKYGIGSPNGFWGDLFVATMWGITWPMFFVAVAISYPFRKLEEKTGIYINITSFIGSLFFGYFTIYLIVRCFAEHSVAKAPYALIVGFFLLLNIRTLRARPYLPKWVSTPIERDMEEYKKAKEQYEKSKSSR